MSGTRRRVRQCSAAAGLTDQRLDDFLIAVSEVLTNAVLHGGGTGSMELRTQPGRIWCQVSDCGPGLPEGFTVSRPNDPRSRSGRGLWLAHQLCDQVFWSSSRNGTSVELAVVLC